MALKTYSFKNVNALFGVLEIKGFADGDDAVIIETEADQFTKVVGSKGDVTRSQTNDDSCILTFKLLQTSDSNGELNTLFTLDKESGLGVLPMTIEDKETGETFFIPNAWITKQPTQTRGQNQNSVEWVLNGDKLITVL